MKLVVVYDCNLTGVFPWDFDEATKEKMLEGIKRIAEEKGFAVLSHTVMTDEEVEEYKNKTKLKPFE